MNIGYCVEHDTCIIFKETELIHKDCKIINKVYSKEELETLVYGG